MAMSYKLSSIAQHVRSSLSENTNDMRMDTSVTALNTSPALQPRLLHHQTSRRKFHPNADSSEASPSEHSSIFEAFPYPSPLDTVTARGYLTGPITGIFVTGGRSAGSWLENETQQDVPRPSTTPNSPTIRTVHHPTPLETISEQKSIATLRQRGNLHVKKKESVVSLLSRPASVQTIKATIRARRKQSFSLDDLPLFHRSSRFLENSSSDSTILSADTKPTLPNQPCQPPPSRVPTPPGLPKFNTPAASNYQLPAPTLRFRDLFRLNDTPEEREWIAQTAALPRGVVMRGENGVLVRGRFRAGQSGHTGGFGRVGEGNLGAIPMLEVSTPVRDSVGRVALTEGAMRGQDDMVIGQASHNTDYPLSVQGPATLRSPLVEGRGAGGTPRQTIEATRTSVLDNEEKESRWSRVGEALCFVCCGAEKSEDGTLHPQMVRSLTDRHTPGYARPLFAGNMGGA